MALPIGLTSKHRWSFHRVGGIFQAQLTTVEDLEALADLDPKLWVALSCPVNDLEIDRETLAFIDFNDDQRVRIEEMLTAVRWTLDRLAKPESLFEGGHLPLDAISTEDAEGAALLASAKQILENVGAPEATAISVPQAADTSRIFGKSRLNGDGVIAQDATDDAEAKALIGEIMDCLDPATDRSGAPGITAAKKATFFSQLAAHEAWWAAGEEASSQSADVFPLGESTPEGFAALRAVEKKIDDYFARCRLAAFDPRAEAPLNHDVSLYGKIADADFSSHRSEVEALPLAKVEASRALPLEDGLNPEWSQRMAAFTDGVLTPLWEESLAVLSEEAWTAVKERFASYRKWRSEKPDTKVEKLKIGRVRELLASKASSKVDTLLAEDEALAPRMKAITSVEKLARFHRDLIHVLSSFVNFSDFYAEDRPAVFQAGSLFLDGRECRLCLRVSDPAKHAVLGTLSRAFVAYCECRRKDSPKTFYIAVVFTAGDAANLIVGRNGVFRDLDEKLWDATIVRIIENPIGVREAFFMPYVRIGRFVGMQLEKWAVSRDKEMQKQMETGVESVGSAADGSEGKKGALGIGSMAGMLAAAGIALGAIGAGLASFFTTLKSLAWWEFPLAVLGLMLAVSLPSVLLAWLKIRKRTLAPLLDANGWAVNGRTLISLRLGRLLTMRAQLPLEARLRSDERSGARPWIWALLGLAILASVAGWAFVLLP